MNKIIVFDNLMQQHSSGILGLTQKVRAVCSVDEYSRLEKVALRARLAADIFRKRFGL